MEKSFSEKVAEATAEISSISPQEARARKAMDSSVLFIDPRDPTSISETTGIIPGAMNLPLDQVEALSDNDLYREFSSLGRAIITSCQGGPMGALLAHALKQRGFNNVAYIEGGTQGWLDAGYSTIK